jgi:hypothetical protein
MDIPLNDGTLFGNDAGEDEDRDVLMSYFVDRPDFADFLNPKVPLKIARARKGMGKSALLVRFAHEVNSSGAKTARPIVLQYVPASLASVRAPPETDNSVLLENYWKQAICAAINIELAESIGFARTDDEITVVETAELAGFKGKNIFGALVSRLLGKIAVGAVELKPTPQTAANPEQLLIRLRKEETDLRPVWFLFDDIDSEFRNTAQQIAYISSFISACRALVRETRGLGIRATVRSDVWPLIAKTEHLDKAVQYFTDIGWSNSEQESILTHRILGYCRRTDPQGEVATSWTVDSHPEKLMGLVFEPRMRWGKHGVRASHVLRILAGGRPRWIAQLCRKAAEKAVKEKSSRIAGQHVYAVMASFGLERVNDLYREHQHQFGELKSLLDSFSRAPPQYTTVELLDRLTKEYVTPTGVEHIPRVDGVPYTNVVQLARFLFKIGFVSGYNAGEKGSAPEFIRFEERPNLLEGNAALDNSVSWVIHPVYRNVLGID